ncbi:hypothetical protein L9F63_001190, partial [Diploptera punctata]
EEQKIWTLACQPFYKLNNNLDIFIHIKLIKWEIHVFREESRAYTAPSILLATLTEDYMHNNGPIPILYKMLSRETGSILRDVSFLPMEGPDIIQVELSGLGEHIVGRFSSSQCRVPIFNKLQSRKSESIFCSLEDPDIIQEVLSGVGSISMPKFYKLLSRESESILISKLYKLLYRKSRAYLEDPDIMQFALSEFGEHVGRREYCGTFLFFPLEDPDIVLVHSRESEGIIRGASLGMFLSFLVEEPDIIQIVEEPDIIQVALPGISRIWYYTSCTLSRIRYYTIGENIYERYYTSCSRRSIFVGSRCAYCETFLFFPVKDSYIINIALSGVGEHLVGNFLSFLLLDPDIIQAAPSGVGILEQENILWDNLVREHIERRLPMLYNLHSVEDPHIAQETGIIQADILGVLFETMEDINIIQEADIIQVVISSRCSPGSREHLVGRFSSSQCRIPILHKLLSRDCSVNADIIQVALSESDSIFWDVSIFRVEEPDIIKVALSGVGDFTIRGHTAYCGTFLFFPAEDPDIINVALSRVSCGIFLFFPNKLHSRESESILESVASCGTFLLPLEDPDIIQYLVECLSSSHWKRPITYKLHSGSQYYTSCTLVSRRVYCGTFVFFLLDDPVEDSDFIQVTLSELLSRDYLWRIPILYKLLSRESEIILWDLSLFNVEDAGSRYYTSCSLRMDVEDPEIIQVALSEESCGTFLYSPVERPDIIQVALSGTGGQLYRMPFSLPSLVPSMCTVERLHNSLRCFCILVFSTSPQSTAAMVSILRLKILDVLSSSCALNARSLLVEPCRPLFTVRCSEARVRQLFSSSISEFLVPLKNLELRCPCRAGVF